MRAEIEKVRKWVSERGPRDAFDQLIAENNALIRAPALDNGRALTLARSAIYTEIIRGWAEDQHQRLGYAKPFAVVALGGTGRAELTPCSDLDLAFLFDDAIEDNAFLLELQRQSLQSDEFRSQHGFSFQALPFNLEDAAEQTGKQLNSFLDMRALYDPEGLADVFREHIRSTYDPFEHFLHVRRFWKDRWEIAASESERLDEFDIKNDGLRLFLAGIWSLAGKTFLHSHTLYAAVDDPRDLEAYYFLLRIRSLIHTRRKTPQRSSATGNHPEDILYFEDFISFADLLGPDADERTRFEFSDQVRARIVAARRRVARFARSVIGRELKNGRAISPQSSIYFGAGGLYQSPPEPDQDARKKSQAAISLLRASQHYGVPIDPSELESTFANAGDWLIRVPEFTELLYEPQGHFADSLAFLAQLDGAVERLFPGHAQFEASLDRRVLSEKKALRSKLARDKIHDLDQMVQEGRRRLDNAAADQVSGPHQKVSLEVESALLDADQLAAIKLALKTKRLPLTEEDLELRENASLPLHERYSSGFSEIPLAEYYRPFRSECALPSETAQLVEFLVANRRAFSVGVAPGIIDLERVAPLVRLCGSEERLRALFVFTAADRRKRTSERKYPVRSFNYEELYVKALAHFRPAFEPTQVLHAQGYSPEQRSILEDFGKDFFGGLYRHHAHRFGEQLVNLVEAPENSGPKVRLDGAGASKIVCIAARDYPGLAATLSGAFWHQQVELSQAHFFSAMNYGLALDFFHLAAREEPLPTGFTAFVEEAIRNRRFISEPEDADVPMIRGEATLREWRPNFYCLRFESETDTRGLIYALTYKVFRHLNVNIYGLTAPLTHGHTFVSVYHNLPVGLSLKQAQAIIEREF